MNTAGKKILAEVAAVVAVSCSVFVLSAASVTTSPISTIALAEPQASPPTCKPPSPSHCYTKETMQRYINNVLPMVVQFFKTRYKAIPEPFHYYFIAEGQRMPMPLTCRDGNDSYFGDKDYAYCPSDHNIYLGQVIMWQLYDEDGSIAPAVGLAHEWGHNIQSWKHVQEPAPKDHSANVKHENQADCVAGAWIQYADQQKWLGPEDFRNIARFIKDIASAESADRDHGTLEQRSNAISQGMKGGLEACNDYYPETPIISSQD